MPDMINDNVDALADFIEPLTQLLTMNEKRLQEASLAILFILFESNSYLNEFWEL